MNNFKHITALGLGILVSSGFIFNGVFFHWFPNFGFAFLLLVILTIGLIPGLVLRY